MHELGVVFHIIDSLEEVAKENDVTQIQSVTIEIGEVSTVIPHYLTDCWEWAMLPMEFATLVGLVREPTCEARKSRMLFRIPSRSIPLRSTMSFKYSSLYRLVR